MFLHEVKILEHEFYLHMEARKPLQSEVVESGRFVSNEWNLPNILDNTKKFNKLLGIGKILGDKR